MTAFFPPHVRTHSKRSSPQRAAASKIWQPEFTVQMFGTHGCRASFTRSSAFVKISYRRSRRNSAACLVNCNDTFHSLLARDARWRVLRLQELHGSLSTHLQDALLRERSFARPSRRTNRKLAFVVCSACRDVRFARPKRTAAGFAGHCGTHALGFLALRRACAVQPRTAPCAFHRPSQRHQRRLLGTAHISPPVRDDHRRPFRHLARAASRHHFPRTLRPSPHAFHRIRSQPLQRETPGKTNPCAHLTCTGQSEIGASETQQWATFRPVLLSSICGGWPTLCVFACKGWDLSYALLGYFPTDN